jgi:hypothetical protein
MIRTAVHPLRITPLNPMKTLTAPILFCAVLSASQAVAAIVSHTLTGVTTTNWVEAGDITAEFPVGTRWTAVVEWDTASAPLFLSATQGQYRLTKLTLTLNGTTGTWTTSSLANQAAFTLSYQGGGTQDEIQFSSGWGPADHTNQTIENWQPYSINLVLSDPTGTALPALSPAPAGINPAGWSPLVANSYLKIYLNNDGNRYILGSIQSDTPAGQPEIAVQQPAGSNLTDGKSKRSFGTVKVGKKGVAKTFTIKNTGKADLTGLSVGRNGSHKSDFIVGALSKTSLAPGASATFKVTFKPKAKGTRKALLKIASNDANENPFDIPVTGLGN